MHKRNICRFIPLNSDNIHINVLNFVYETKKFNNKPITLSTYRTAIAVHGNGILHICGKQFSLCKGDLFFTFPSVPFFIESKDDFEYIYISYIGIRANIIMDKFNISYENCVFNNMNEVIDLWKNSISFSDSVSDLRSEGILLYTLSIIGERLASEETENNYEAIKKIKNYIDLNFQNPDLSISKISSEMLYNEKYISSMFKKHFKQGISNYITTIRIQYACELINKGLKNISDISLLCGYKDPLYFSKTFKKIIGIPPREHIKSISEKK